MLSDEQHEFFAREGYLIVPALVPETTEQVQAETWALLAAQHGMLRKDEDSWYGDDGVAPKRGGFVPLLNSQGQWDQRQHPLVHRVFAELWGTEKLWTSVSLMTLCSLRRSFCHLTRSVITCRLRRLLAEERRGLEQRPGWSA